jgi:hypothetical protein
MEKGTDTSNLYNCWLWERKLNSQGYATFQIMDEVTGKERTYRARRFAYEEVFNTKLTSDDWLISYVCNEPRCVNPFHATRTTRDGWYVDQGKAFMEQMRRRIEAKSKI